MKSYLAYPKEKFEKELISYIETGTDIIQKSQVKNITSDEFEALEIEYKHWKEEVLELLKQRFDNPANEYHKEFDRADFYNPESMSAVYRGANPNDIKFRYKFFKSKSEKKVEALKSILKKLKYIPVEQKITSEEDNTSDTLPKKIFISHSSLDSKIVEKIIDILEVVGVPSELIFCSSFEGYGVKLGSDFLEVIKKELNNKVLVLFVLSENFYSSAVSLCEMGATWVKTNRHIPIIVPPFNYKDIKGVIPTTLGMKINEREKFNSLKEIVEEFILLEPINFSIWERKRDNILKEINQILDESQLSKPNNPEKIEIQENYFTQQVEFTLKTKNFSNEIELIELENVKRPSQIQKEKIENILEKKRTEAARLKKMGIKNPESFSFGNPLISFNSIISGVGTPYEDRDINTLEKNLKNVENTYLEDDYYELFEKQANKCNIAIFNKGDKYIEDATLILKIPKVDGLLVLDKVYPKPNRNAIVGNIELLQMYYPEVSEEENYYIVKNTVGDIKHKLSTNAFGDELRVFATNKMDTDTIKMTCELFAKNIKTSIKKEIEIKTRQKTTAENV